MMKYDDCDSQYMTCANELSEEHAQRTLMEYQRTFGQQNDRTGSFLHY